MFSSVLPFPMPTLGHMAAFVRYYLSIHTEGCRECPSWHTERLQCNAEQWLCESSQALPYCKWTGQGLAAHRQVKTLSSTWHDWLWWCSQYFYAYLHDVLGTQLLFLCMYQWKWILDRSPTCHNLTFHISDSVSDNTRRMSDMCQKFVWHVSEILDTCQKIIGPPGHP